MRPNTMHELSIAQSIFDIVTEHIPEGNGATVRSVRLKIGELAGVVPDSLEFCFSAIVNGTPLEGARLDIEKIPLVCSCMDCGTTFPVRESVFMCSSCGSSRTSILSGRELQVTEIEIADEGTNAS